MSERHATDAASPTGSTTTSDAAPAARPPNRVQVAWKGEHLFEGGRPGYQAVPIDASGKQGPGPVDTLLIALASCTAVDVVDILAKRRTPAESLNIEVVGERASATPRRLVHVLLHYTITGASIEREQAERFIALAITKYCSVRDSLDPTLPVDYTLTLNGEAGATYATL